MNICAESLDQLDLSVRLKLADSLDSLWQQAGATLGADTTRQRALLDHIRNHRVHPRLFARYYDLVLAILEHEPAEARRVNAGLLSLPAEPLRGGIRPYSRAELGEDFERFARLLFAEEGLERPLAAPEPEQTDATRGHLMEAIKLVAAVDSATGAEVCFLWPLIYLARPDQVGRFRFAGVTSFMVWGAGVMNVEAFDTPLAIAEFLVHETTHSLLFAMGCEDPLVLNPLDQSYPSPLRADPRPMDGIFHATVVCARTAAFLGRSLDSPTIDPRQHEGIRQRLRNARDSYAAGREVIARHGQLSGRAQALLETCDRTLATVA